MTLSSLAIEAAEFAASVFGGGLEQEQPLQIELVRSKAVDGELINGKPIRWRWTVVANSFDPKTTEALFRPLILSCVNAVNPDLAAKVVLKASRTNVGEEVEIDFENAFFITRGKRKLLKAFNKVSKALKEAEEAVAWAWSNRLQQDLEEQVKILISIDPKSVEYLKIQLLGTRFCKDCGGHHPNDNEVFLNFGGIPVKALGEVNFYDQGNIISASPYRKAVLESVQSEVRKLVRVGMIEYMQKLQDRLIRRDPLDMLGQLMTFLDRAERMNKLGLEVAIHDRIKDLTALLNGYLRDDGGPISPDTTDTTIN